MTECKFFSNYRSLLFVIVFLAISQVNPAEINPPSDLSSAITMLLEFPSKLESLDDLLDLFGEIPGNQILTGVPWNSITSEKNPLPSPIPIVSEKMPKAADEAIHDFRRSIAKDFIKYAGSADKVMTRSQFQTLVGDGRLPVKEDSDDYFQGHDKDGDGKLSIWEFVPAAPEVAQKHDLDVIANAYLKGIPYPTGNYPTSRPISAPPGPLPGTGTAVLPPAPNVFLTKAEVEQRLTDFANRQGFSTTTAPDGKLIVVDSSGQPVPIPPGVLPPPVHLVVQQLNQFAAGMGGTVEKGPEGLPIVKDKDGKNVSPENWPPHLRPPYMPPGGPPGPPPPPGR